MRFQRLLLFIAAVPCIATASTMCDGDWMKLNAPELEQCNIEKTQQVESKLRRAYQNKLRQLAKATEPTGVSNTKIKKTLAASQKVWEQYRRLQCDFLLEQMGEASLGPAWYQGCMQEYAIDRIKWLEKNKQ